MQLKKWNRLYNHYPWRSLKQPGQCPAQSHLILKVRALNKKMT